MAIVFDEVVADVRPDREEPQREQQGGAAKKGPTMEEIQAAIAWRARLNARLEAH
jgi:hypothetical protein